MNPAAPSAIPDADVHAYADGQLAPDRAALIDAALAADPDLAARVAAIRAQSAALRDALDPVLAEPIPDRLLAAAAPPAARTHGSGMRRWLIGAPSRFALRYSPLGRPGGLIGLPSRFALRYSPLGRPGGLMPAFAAAAALIAGVGLGWFGRDAMIEYGGTPTTFARQAAFAHALYATDARRPVEVWASEEKSLVAWLTKRLGFQVHAPDLNGIGYALVGGRLVAGNEKPTALFMYENADRERLTLQVRKQATRVAQPPTGAGETAFRYSVESGVGVFYWIDHDCGYAISGKLDRAQLLKIAHAVYGQLAALEGAAPKWRPVDASSVE